MSDDRRLIEDFLPIQAISAEASREKSIRRGHISTLHLWWARRPLVACRAAVYGALVPASRFVPENGPDNKKQSLGRANAAKFVTRLCRYPSESNPEQRADIDKAIKEARQHILEAHAERLTREAGKRVTVQDVEEGRAPRPKVLDMFAGGGAIPLEALRLGCDAYALDLNPVAHIIELCTLVYPQKYGRPDSNARGMTGPKNAKGETTWGGLADEVRYWGDWVLQKVKAEIGDLYPAIPDMDSSKSTIVREKQSAMYFAKAAHKEASVSPGQLTPVAYLWTRTVRCKNASCRATVPLVRQTWLCKKKDRYVALQMVTTGTEKRVRFKVVQDDGRALPQDDDWVKELRSKEKNITESKLHELLAVRHFGFDPADFSKGGDAACRFCPTVADSDYVKAEGRAKRIGMQIMAAVCSHRKERGKRYLGSSDLPDDAATRANADALGVRTETIATKYGISVPDEQLEANPRSFDVQHFGFAKWSEVFAPRQLAAMAAFGGVIRSLQGELKNRGFDIGVITAICTCLSMALGRLADYCNSFCTWQPEFVKDMYNSPGLPMVMDFAEANPIAETSGSWPSAVDYVAAALESFVMPSGSATVFRGSAMKTAWQNDSFDAIITDPPYYDSRSYSNLSDHFYIWHKRSVGSLHSEHFASDLTPKKSEAIVATYRHGGSREGADRAYESMMEEAFSECNRVLRSGMPLVCVYAHKTTTGWSTLINALMRAGFVVAEAWPVEMERKVRQNAQETAALASSVFLVARKRENAATGSYEDEVRPELEQIVRERVDSLWKMGIAGGDLVIAAVGAGLRAFTRFGRVEYANGEEVPAKKFLAEVEGVVLETLLEKIFGVPGKGVAAVDGPTRFYVLWRHTYGVAEMDAGEAIVFTYGQNVELDGPNGLSAGSRALVKKKKGNYLLRDFSERGDDDRLGVRKADGSSAALIDALHRILWLLENQPRKLNEFLDEARPDRERLRLVAQALAGTSLAGKRDEEPEQKAVATAKEQAALNKLVANWRSLIESRLADMDSKTGQQRLPI